MSYKIEGREYEIATCPSCGVIHLFPEPMYAAAMTIKRRGDPEKYNSIYCPNGHAWHYIQPQEKGGKPAAPPTSPKVVPPSPSMDKKSPTDNNNGYPLTLAHGGQMFDWWITEEKKS